MYRIRFNTMAGSIKILCGFYMRAGSIYVVLKFCSGYTAQNSNLTVILEFFFDEKDAEILKRLVFSEFQRLSYQRTTLASLFAGLSRSLFQ